MRMAISGTSGFIGGHVCKLLAGSNEVVTIGRRANCTIQVDFSKSESIKVIDLRGIDVFVHCAGIVDEDFLIDPASAYVQSTLGMSALLQKLIACGVPRFVYFSTAHVYGPFVGYITEETPVNPLSDYAIAHYAAEQTIRRYASKQGLTALVLRPNAVYGIPINMATFDRWHIIPYLFPLEAVYKQRVSLRTDGSQRRNFIDAIDLTCYVEKFILSKEQNNFFKIVNPLGAETLSVYEFALKCANIYTNLTGEYCIIDRPEPTLVDDTYRFLYGSVEIQYPPLMTIDNYLITFMQRIIQDLKNGIKYGTS